MLNLLELISSDGGGGSSARQCNGFLLGGVGSTGARVGDVLARRLYRGPLIGVRMTGGMMPCLADLPVPGSVFGGLRWCLVGVLNPSISSSGISSSGIPSSIISVDVSEVVASSSFFPPVVGTGFV